ncbi:MAG TPA: pyridoxamine 5'-phosphate oxidase family protein [Ilumatobacteraceae bacterium]|jgi:F420H(2)-dependent biliverdin reductase|nr:pyridoxamine 5'-phosphate oxidase family protein [Ilumatobacteraceae bacterium]
MALDPADLPDEVLTFLREYHLATLTTLREDLSPHVVAVGFSYDVEARIVRVITWAGSQKAVNAARMETAGQRAAVGQVDGGRWLSLEGPVRLITDPDGVRAGVDGYAARYRQPKERDDRVVIEISVERILGRG